MFTIVMKQKQLPRNPERAIRTHAMLYNPEKPAFPFSVLLVLLVVEKKDMCCYFETEKYTSERIHGRKWW